MKTPGISNLIHTRMTTAACRSSIPTAILIAMLFTYCSRARAAAPTTLPASVVTSATPSQSAIEEFLSSAIARLKSDNAVEQQKARDAILAPLGQSPSPGFIYTYSIALNSKLVPLTKEQSFRVRLNVAVIAEKFKNAYLLPTIQALLKDQNEAVALWALKAIKPVMTAPMIGAVKDTAKRFPSLTAAAYEALSIDPPQDAYIAAIQDLFDARIAMYADGVPPEPLAELKAMNQLVNTGWWHAQKPAQQTRTAQLLVNLAAEISKQVNNDMLAEQAENLRRLVRGVGASMATIGVVGDSSKLPLKEPGLAIQKLPLLAAASAVQTSINTVITDLKAAFSAITVPTTAPSATKPPKADGSISGQ